MKKIEKKLIRRTKMHKHKLEENREEGHISHIHLFFGMSLAVICFVLLFAGVGVASATDYYVATWGSDSNNGTSIDYPWQHPSYAAQQAQAGDTIYLLDGTWYDEHVVFAHSGTDGNPIIMKAYNGTPTLSGNSGSAISNSKSYITIEGLTIKGYETGFYILAESGSIITNITLRNNIISDTLSVGIWLRNIGSSKIYNATILDNIITNAQASDVSGAIFMSGVYDSLIENNTIVDTPNCPGINGGGVVRNTLVANNHIENTGWHGITFYDAKNVTVRDNMLRDIKSRGIRFDYHCTDNKIINNILKNVADSGINLYPGTETVIKGNYFENTSVYTVSPAYALFENNIWQNKNEKIIDIDGDTGELIFKNNAFVKCTEVVINNVTNSGIIKNNIFMDSPLKVIHPSPITVTYNDFWNSSISGVTPSAGNIYVNPLFADISKNDFHLKSQYGRWNGSAWVQDNVTSLCIDAGDPKDDYSNEPKPKGGRINMGAYGNTVEASRSPKIESKGVYYIAPYGDDANNGITLETAWRHISYAASKAQPGDTILIVGGVYKDEHVVFTNSGNATHPIVMKAYNGTPTLDGVDKTGVGLKIADESYIEIYGLKIKNYDIGIKGEGILQNITIGNFTIEDIKSEGLNFDSASLQNSIITNFIIRNTGGRAISHYDFGSTDCRDVEISHFIIKDIDSAGILWENAKRVHIHHGEIHNTTGDGIRLYKNLNSSVVEHVLVNKTGWHGIAIHDPYMNRPCYDNIIRNCEVIGASHGAINLHSGAFNTTVENCTLVGPPYTVGIYFHNRGEGLIARNNVIKNMLRGIYADAYSNGSVIKNAVFVNNTIYNDTEYSGGDGQNGLLENISFINNTFINCSSDGSYSALSFWYGKNVLLKGNRFINPPHPEEPQIQVKYCTGDVIIEDLKDRVTKIRAVSTSAEVRFTDGKVFSENGINTPYWHPDKSNYSLVNETVRFITHNMTAVPSSGYATITVNKFNTSLPQGEILVNFTSNTTNGTNVVFTVGDLIPNKYYLIRKDCNSFTTKRADSTGHITFSNSEWRSAHTFTVEEIPPTPRTGLVGLWHFDEGAGTTAGDSSGNNNNGTLIDNPDWVDGKIGKALEFNGSTNYVEINDSDSLDGFDEITIEAWVKPILGQRGAVVSRYLYDYNIPINERVYELTVEPGGTIEFALSSDGSSATWLESNNTVQDNEWNHIAAVSDGNTMRIYINGEQDPNTKAAPASLHSSSYNLQIGTWEYSPNQRDTYFNGVIDEVKIYNRALSAEEIKADYEAGISPASSSISGFITYACNETGLAGVTVNLSLSQPGNGNETPAIKSTVTDSNGSYMFINVYPGTYNITASRRGFWYNSSSVTVTGTPASESYTLNLTLWLKGDLNNNGKPADDADVSKMENASIGEISPDWRYDLNRNSIAADAGDLAMIKDASAGNLIVLE